MPLSKNECTVLRGLGILAILLHNYCHWLEGALMENELTFVQERSDAFYAYAVHPDGNAFLQFFSFFGHYGICVFLFLTGYGLTIKYKLQKTEQIAFLPFVWRHYKKLLWLLVGGYVLYQLVIFVGTTSFSGNLFDWVSMLTMTSNFFSLDTWPKPYWYFGLTMQMYLLFYLLVYRTDGNLQVMTILGLMTAASLMPQFVFSPDSDVVRLLRDNFFIGMLPFTLGVTAALYGKRLKESMKTLYLFIGCIISGLLLFFSNLNLISIRHRFFAESGENLATVVGQTLPVVGCHIGGAVCDTSHDARDLHPQTPSCKRSSYRTPHLPHLHRHSGIHLSPFVACEVLSD